MLFTKKLGLFSKTSSTNKGSNKGIGTLISIPIIVKNCPQIRLFLLFKRSLYMYFKDIFLFMDLLYLLLATIYDYYTVLL